MKLITSSENKIYKETKKLLLHSGRTRQGLFIAEGERIVADALKSGSVRHLIINEEYKGKAEEQTEAYCFSKKLFEGVSDTKTTQGILAVCEMKDYKPEDLLGGMIVICDGVADPGNLGTIIRTAECTGAGGVFLLGGCADPYNPKTVRSTMGSIFRIPVCRIETEGLSLLKDYDIAAAVLDGSKDLYDVSFDKKTAIIIGSEAHGVSGTAADYANLRLKIPMCGSAESLNASVAAGVIMYEVFRQTR